MRPLFYLCSLCLPILILSCQSTQKENKNPHIENEESKLTVNLRKMVMSEGEENGWEGIEYTEIWDPQKTAIIVTDMWDRHWCESATERVAAMAPGMNKTLTRARNLALPLFMHQAEPWISIQIHLKGKLP